MASSPRWIALRNASDPSAPMAIATQAVSKRRQQHRFDFRVGDNGCEPVAVIGGCQAVP